MIISVIRELLNGFVLGSLLVFTLGCSDKIKRLEWAENGGYIRLEGSLGPKSCTQFSQNGKMLAVGGFFKASSSPEKQQGIILWDVQTAKRVKTFSCPEEVEGLISAICFSPDGAEILAITNKFWVTRWDLATGKVVTSEEYEMPAIRNAKKNLANRIFRLSGGPISEVALKEDGQAVALAFVEYNHRPSDEARWPAILWLPGVRAENLLFRQLDLSRDGQTLIASVEDHVEVLNISSTGKETILKIDGIPSCRDITFSSDEKMFAIRLSDGVEIRELQNGRKVNEVSYLEYDSRTDSIALSTKGRFLAIGQTYVYMTEGRLGIKSSPNSVGKLILLDAHSSGTREIVPFPENAIPDAPGNPFGTTPLKVQLNPSLSPKVHSVEFSPDGNFLASTHEAGKVVLWSIPTVFNN